MKFVCWFIVVIGCVVGATCFIGAIAGKSDAEKTAAATMSLVFVAIPYVFAKAITSLVQDDHHAQCETLLAEILQEMRKSKPD